MGVGTISVLLAILVKNKVNKIIYLYKLPIKKGGV